MYHFWHSVRNLPKLKLTKYSIYGNFTKYIVLRLFKHRCAHVTLQYIFLITLIIIFTDGLEHVLKKIEINVKHSFDLKKN